MAFIVFGKNQKGEVYFVNVFDSKEIEEGKNEIFTELVLLSLINIDNICYTYDLAAISDD